MNYQKKYTLQEPTKELLMENRREFLKKMSIAPFLMGSMPLFVSTGHAKSLDWEDIKYVLKLNLVRFVAGLIFDVAKVVIVNYVKDDKGEYSYYSGLPNDKDNFNNTAYKKAVIQVHPIRYGMSDEEYLAYKSQYTNIKLYRDEDIERFDIIHKHLVDARTRIAFVGDNSSRKITTAMTPSMLFNTKYMLFRDDNEERHYQKLLEETQVKVFHNLSV